MLVHILLHVVPRGANCSVASDWSVHFLDLTRVEVCIVLRPQQDGRVVALPECGQSLSSFLQHGITSTDLMKLCIVGRPLPHRQVRHEQTKDIFMVSSSNQLIHSHSEELARANIYNDELSWT